MYTFAQAVLLVLLGGAFGFIAGALAVGWADSPMRGRRW